MESLFIHSIATSFIAQGDAPNQGMGSMIFMFLLMGGVWLLIMAPHKKRQKEHQQMLTALKIGDTVLTGGGIFGEITKVKEDRFIVKIAENTKVEISKASVQNLVPKK